jgi:hypothetical protein
MCYYNIVVIINPKIGAKLRDQISRRGVSDGFYCPDCPGVARIDVGQVDMDVVEDDIKWTASI